MAEYTSSGIWLVFESGSTFRHGMIEYNDLGIPVELARRFKRWIDTYESLKFDDTEFDLEGRELAKELKQFVGGDARVLYQPYGGDRSEEFEIDDDVR